MHMARNSHVIVRQWPCKYTRFRSLQTRIKHCHFVLRETYILIRWFQQVALLSVEVYSPSMELFLYIIFLYSRLLLISDRRLNIMYRLTDNLVVNFIFHITCTGSFELKYKLIIFWCFLLLSYLVTTRSTG